MSDLSLTATVACPNLDPGHGLVRRDGWVSLLILLLGRRLGWLCFRPGREASHEHLQRPGAFTITGEDAADVEGLASFDDVTAVHPHLILGRVVLVFRHWDASPFK